MTRLFITPSFWYSVIRRCNGNVCGLKQYPKNNTSFISQRRANDTPTQIIKSALDFLIRTTCILKWNDFVLHMNLLRESGKTSYFQNK